MKCCYFNLQGRFFHDYSPVRYFPYLKTFNSHVLSILQAFTLSQDQTHII